MIAENWIDKTIIISRGIYPPLELITIELVWDTNISYEDETVGAHR